LIDKDGRQVLIPTLWGVSTPLLGATDLVKVGAETSELARTAVEVGKSESHHLIPRSLENNPVVESAREGGFKLEGKGNRIEVEKFSKATGEGQHGKHPNYTRQIEEKLNKFENENPNATPEQAAKAVEKVSGDAASDIKNNPDIKINDLKLNEVTLPSDNTKIAKTNIIIPVKINEEKK